MRVSYTGVINDDIIDLLVPENRKLKVYENTEVCFNFFSLEISLEIIYFRRNIVVS